MFLLLLQLEWERYAWPWEKFTMNSIRFVEFMFSGASGGREGGIYQLMTGVLTLTTVFGWKHGITIVISPLLGEKNVSISIGLILIWYQPWWRTVSPSTAQNQSASTHISPDRGSKSSSKGYICRGIHLRNIPKRENRSQLPPTYFDRIIHIEIDNQRPGFWTSCEPPAL